MELDIYSTHEQGTIEVNTIGNSYSINVNPVQWGGLPEPEPEPEPEPAPNQTRTRTKPEPEPVQTGFANCTELRTVYPDGVNS